LRKKYSSFIRALLLILLFAVSSLIMFSPILREFKNWGIGDWDQHIFYHAVPRLTILEYRQIPLWNPYHCGGSPLLAYPQSYLLSPAFLISLILGVIPGVKIEMLVFSAVGLCGAYLVARFYRLGTIASIVAAFVFMFNSMYSFSIAAGMLNFLNIYLIPWIFLFFLKSLNDLRYCLLSGLFCVLLFFGGGVHVLIITLTSLAIYSVVSIISGRSRPVRTVQAIGLILSITLFLGAVKFLPSLEFTNMYPRLIDDYSGYSLSSIFYSVFNPYQTLYSEVNLSSSEGFLRGISWGLDDNGMYLGVVTFLFFIIGYIFSFKKRLPLALTLLFLLWLSFGDRVTPSLWGILRQLPIYNLQRVATRYRYVLALCVSVFAGMGVQFLKDYLLSLSIRRLIVKIIIVTIPVVIFFDFMLVNRPILQEAFPVNPPDVPGKKQFFQTWLPPEYNRRGEIISSALFEGSSFYNFLMNVGTISAIEPVPISAYALPIDSEEYKGEVYLSGTEGKIAIKDWSPNRIVINVEAEQEGSVIVNQNYFPGWKVKGSGDPKIEEIDGLVGVRVPPGRNTFMIYYLPATFQIGLMVSLATLLMILLISGRYFYKWRQQLFIK